MKKIAWIFTGICLLFLLVLNNYYGPILYSKITDQEDLYRIGKACSISRAECELTYFQRYLDKRVTLESKNRKYFEEIIIDEDQYGYSGNCPCPYNSDSRGGSCGGRSSYSKGGSISYCYGSDISDEHVTNKKQMLINEITEQLNNGVQKTLDVYNEKITLYLLLFLYICLFFLLKKNIKADFLV